MLTQPKPLTHIPLTQPEDRSLLSLGSFVFFHYLPTAALLLLWGYVYVEHSSFFNQAEQTVYIWPLGILAMLVTAQTTLLVVGSASRLGWSMNTAIILSAIYVLLIIIFFIHGNAFILDDIASWTQPMDYLVYSTSAFIPAILYTVTLYATGYSGFGLLKNAWLNLLSAFLLPITIYLILSLGLFNHHTRDYSFYLILLASAALTILFFYAIIRSAVIWARRKEWSDLGLATKFIVTTLLPIFCLFLNAKIGGGNQSGLLGNFNHWVYYALALVNGFIISLPLNKWLPQTISFAARLIMLPFSLYFFVVLAPLLPFAMVLTIFLGLGLLLIVPAMVLWLHIHSIRQNYIALRLRYTTSSLMLAGAVAILLMPAGLHLAFMYERTMLHSALDHLNQPTQLQATYWESSLKYVIQKVKRSQSAGDFLMNNKRTPMLDSWHNRAVLDGLQLSSENQKKINQVFLGHSPATSNQGTRWQRPQNSQVILDTLSAESRWNAEAACWQSNIHLKMRNTDKGMREYSTQFNLPAGAFISDYYLYVGNEKKPGILAERKAATWVYNQITRQRRDPGLLRYSENGQVELRVFLFVGTETRKSGFTILHKEPIVLTIDSSSVTLGNASHVAQPIQLANSLYMPGHSTQKLPLVKRQPVAHFIINCGVGQGIYAKSYQKTIDYLLTKYPALKAEAKIVLVNHSVETVAYHTANWQNLLNQQNFTGGFFLSRALEVIYNQQVGQAYYALPIVLSPNLDNAVLAPSFIQIAYAFPELDEFYHLQPTGKLVSYNLLNPTQEPANATLATHKVVRLFTDKNGNKTYLKNTPESQIIPLPYPSNPTKYTPWENGIMLWADWQQAGLGASPSTWAQQVRQSFASHILSPYTAFMVVEEAWQEALLAKKQEQFLNGHPVLDSDTEEMPEPGFWLLLTIVLMLWLWKNRHALFFILKTNLKRFYFLRIL